MNLLFNLDLLTVGITIAGIGILGFAVYFNNKQSVTNKTFLLFSIITIAWSIVNYFSYYQVGFVELSFWLNKIVIFLGVWHSFLFFKLAYVFPKEIHRFPKKYKRFLLPFVGITSIITLTPLVFKRVEEVSEVGRIIKIENGPGIALFGITVMSFIISGIVVLLRKTMKSEGAEKIQFKLVAIGTLLTFLLIIIFNFILPAMFDNPRFIPLGSMFIFPFVAFTSYAILKHKLFNIKVAATASLTFILSIVTFLEIIFARDLSQVIFRSSVFILVLVFGIMLIRTVLKEVRLREEVEILAGTLQKANARLRELDKLKSEFVSFATHQIRAPVTAIKGYASMILEGSFGPVAGQLKDAVDKIFQSSESLVSVIEDYLNISRIELGRMQYSMSEFDFKKLVEDIAVELTPTIKKAGLDVSVHKELGKDYRIKGDSGKLRQVITNLIDNSVKYTPKGSIRIELSKNGASGKILFAVSDTGVGISKETMPHLFEKFKRARNANNVNIHGTGLGLFIAKQIIEAHKGRIWAQSQGEGKGSAFFVEVDAEK